MPALSPELSPGPTGSVLILGYFGYGNTGDEAILEVLLDDLRSVAPQLSPVVAGGDSSWIEARHGVRAVSLGDPEALLTEVAEAGLVVVGGGGLFNDHWLQPPEEMFTPFGHFGLSLWAGYAELAALLGKRVAIYGAGVGPLESGTGQRLTASAFRLATTASVRDRMSLEVVNRLQVADVALGADPALRLRPSPPAVVPRILSNEGAPEGDGPMVVAALRNWGDNEFVGAVVEALDDWMEGLGARVLLVPLQRARTPVENDLALGVEVRNRLARPHGAAILRGAYPPGDLMAVIAASDLVLGMRLHALLFAAATGVPAVALAYDPKVSAMLAEWGRPEWAFPLDDAGRVAESGRKLLQVPPSPAWPEADAVGGRGQAVVSELARAVASPVPLAPITRHTTDGLLARAHEALQLRREVAGLEQTLIQVKVEAAGDRRLLETRPMRLAVRLANWWWQSVHRLRRRRIPPGERPNLAAQLNQILAAHPGAPGYVVFPPNIGWRTDLFQRPQQMALAFARQGYLVFFGLGSWHHLELGGMKPVAEGVYLFSYRPGDEAVLALLPRPLMVGYVYNFDFARHLDHPVTVFEHIDGLEVFAASYPEAELQAWFKAAVAEADIVTASARDLLAPLLPARPDAVLCPNGVDYDHFAYRRPSSPAPPLTDHDSPDGERPVIGYYGAMAEWLDYDLIAEVARGLPEYRFVFIGPDYDRSHSDREAFSLPNVSWLGPREYSDLPAYLHDFTVATIPFRLSEVTHAVSPIKLFEYMAAGKPVVATPMRELLHYQEVLTAATAGEWVERLKEAVRLSGDRDYQELLRATARANTWDQRAGLLIDRYSAHLLRGPGH
jgi:polysaccharide pyruvyl transferase CsaB